MARNRRNRNRLKIDPVVAVIYTLLVFWGWLSIHSAVYNEEAASLFNLSQEYGKQLLFIGGSFVIILGILLSNYRLWTNFAPFWYILTLLLLIGVLFVGKKIGGARSWYALGSFSLQPSEVAKFATALMLAFYLGQSRTNMKLWSHRLIAAALFLIPGFLIGLQPDLGSTLVYLSLLLVLYREGMPGYYIGAALALIALAIIGLLLPLRTALVVLGSISLLLFLLLPKRRGPVAANASLFSIASATVFAVGQVMERVLAPHQQIRIKVLLGLEDDPTGAGYNTLQSLIAIGSGGWTGKGYLNGTQTKLNFVPEQSTDYIFCTIGEEWGFLGPHYLCHCLPF
jgi:rod shape determining protein RodA